jgi:hypothetical protein
MNKTVFAYSLIFSSLLSSSVFSKAYVDKTETLASGGTEYSFDTTVFSPTSYSDLNGKSESLESGEAFFSTDFLITGSYGFNNNLQASIGLNFRLTQSTGTYADEDKTLSATGFEALLAQIKYSFDPVRRLQYSLEFNYRQASYTNKFYTLAELPEVPDEMAIGEGVRELSAGLGFSFITESQNFFTGKFLFVQRDGDLSNEIFSELEFAIAWQYFALIAGVENIYSLNQDAFSDNPEDKPRLSRGSSRELNSINRSWTAPYLGMNIGLGDKWRLELLAKSRVTAASAYLGNEVLFNLVRRNSSKNEFAKKDAAFKEYRYEGSVTKVSKSKKALTIDMGLEDGIEKGSKIDIYFFDYLEGNTLVASGYAVRVGTTKAIVKITKKYTKEKLRAGLNAKAGLIRN